MSINRRVRGENRLYIPPPMRKLQQEREKERLEAEEEKRKAKKLLIEKMKKLKRSQDSIPADLLIDIFSRVPAKSIARFSCVSKFWESILGRPDFTELFLTRSGTRPRLVFTLEVNKELLVFSSPQPQNPNNNSSLVVTRYKSFTKHFSTELKFQICNPLCGFFFLQSWNKKPRVICNPVTGEFINLRSLPKVQTKNIMGNYFGFDPIRKEFKVLCVTRSRYGRPNTHRVLTLGTGKRIWRTILDPLFPHIPRGDGICINGVLYYRADFEGSYKIVCFDLRFEKFSIINMDKDMPNDNRYRLTLFNNKGKLGAYMERWGNEEVALWVLEDAGKHKWSKRICLLPKTVNKYRIAGITGTCDIVFSSYHRLSNPFYIFYYNIERNTFTRVSIKGFEEFIKEDHPILVRTFLDYGESVQRFIT